MTVNVSSVGTVNGGVLLDGGPSTLNVVDVCQAFWNVLIADPVTGDVSLVPRVCDVLPFDDQETGNVSTACLETGNVSTIVVVNVGLWNDVLAIVVRRSGVPWHGHGDCHPPQVLDADLLSDEGRDDVHDGRHNIPTLWEESWNVVRCPAHPAFGQVGSDPRRDPWSSAELIGRCTR